MRELLKDLVQSLDARQEVVACQVVETKGSTPQKAGAWMLVDPSGAQKGTLGGGCVEAEVKQKALQQVGVEGPAVYSFVLDHDYAWADGLICGGKMVILAEWLSGPSAADYFRAYQSLVEQGLGLTELVSVDPEKAGTHRPGVRVLADSEGQIVTGWPEVPSSLDVTSLIRPLEDRPRPLVKHGWAMLPTLPRIKLLIVGAGHVGQAVAALATKTGFDVWVIDDRRQYANETRFPNASRLIVGPLDEVLPGLEIDTRTYALIVTRGHGHDQEALYYLAPTPAPYVGMIGSRRKIRMIFETLRTEGIEESALARVSAPVGLDIGSESVEEIAVSIVAELVARRNLGPKGAVGNAFTLEEPTNQPVPS
jgi:xanthine dehydrogenase accessory factor